MGDHIHTPNDGRGHRVVYLDGVKVEKCCYADTERGIVRAYFQPLRICQRRKLVRSFKRRGRVEVVLRG